MPVFFYVSKGARRILKLDEKKIRKGKAVGLPYVGSKKKISKKIVEIIKQNFGTDKPVYDVFGGGGAITAELMLNGLDVHYNDINKDVTDMFERVISQDREWIKTLICSREEFLSILDKEKKTVDDNLKLLVNSFGNRRETYLYGKERASMKYNLAVEIIEKYDVFSGYKQTSTYKEAKRKYDESELKKAQALRQLEQLPRLEQLTRLKQLASLEQPKVTNKDYKAFSKIEGAIFYLDPPYEKAVNYYCASFDNQEFYDWCVQMAKHNTVLISSYDISDKRFEAVYEFKKARSTLQGGINSNQRYEKLFMVKSEA